MPKIIEMPLKFIGTIPSRLWDAAKKIPLLGKVVSGTENVVKRIPGIGKVVTGIGNRMDGWRAQTNDYFGHFGEQFAINTEMQKQQPFLSGIRRMLDMLKIVALKLVQTLLESLNKNTEQIGKQAIETEKAEKAANMARLKADTKGGLVPELQARSAEKNAEKAVDKLEEVKEKSFEQMEKDFGSLGPGKSDVNLEAVAKAAEKQGIKITDVTQAIESGNAKALAEKGIAIAGGGAQDLVPQLSGASRSF